MHKVRTIFIKGERSRRNNWPRRWTYKNHWACENGFFCWSDYFFTDVLMRIWDYPVKKNFWTCNVSTKVLRPKEEVHSTGPTIGDFGALTAVFFAKEHRRAHSVIAQIRGRDLVGLNAYGNSTSRNASWRLQTVLELVAKNGMEASDPITTNQVPLCGKNKLGRPF